MKVEGKLWISTVSYNIYKYIIYKYIISNVLTTQEGLLTWIEEHDPVAAQQTLEHFPQSLNTHMGSCYYTYFWGATSLWNCMPACYLVLFSSSLFDRLVGLLVVFFLNFPKGREVTIFHAPFGVLPNRFARQSSVGENISPTKFVYTNVNWLSQNIYSPE